MKVDPNDPAAKRHNPLKPLAFQDATLNVFAPK
jgi:hypothetical protein